MQIKRIPLKNPDAVPVRQVDPEEARDYLENSVF